MHSHLFSHDRSISTRNALKPIAIAVAILGASGTAANADILHYQAQLRGAAETPANATRARGEVTAILDTDRRAFEYTVTYKDLSGPVVVAGFKQPTSPPDDPIVTAIADPKTTTIHAVVTLTNAQIQDLNAGKWIFRHLDQRQSGRRDPRQVERTTSTERRTLARQVGPKGARQRCDQPFARPPRPR